VGSIPNGAGSMVLWFCSYSLNWPFGTSGTLVLLYLDGSLELVEDNKAGRTYHT